jgi:hypothetical protein
MIVSPSKQFEMHTHFRQLILDGYEGFNINLQVLNLQSKHGMFLLKSLEINPPQNPRVLLPPNQLPTTTAPSTHLNAIGRNYL